MKLFLILVLFSIFFSNAFCADLTFFSTLGYGSHDHKGGAEIDFGFKLSPYENIVIDIVPISGIIVPNDNSRYEEQNISNKTICRDKSNGQFSDKSNCGPSYKYGFLTSVKYVLLPSLEGGLGARIGDGISIFIEAFYKINPKYGIECKIGSNYTNLSLRYDF